MRRVLLWVLIGLLGAETAVQAGERFARRHGGYGVEIAPDSIGPYGYGRRLRGGYGRNGYAPVFGPVWGPTAFLPGAGKSVDLRPNGSYVRPLGPPEMLVELDDAATPDGNALPSTSN